MEQTANAAPESTGAANADMPPPPQPNEIFGQEHFAVLYEALEAGSGESGVNKAQFEHLCRWAGNAVASYMIVRTLLSGKASVRFDPQGRMVFGKREEDPAPPAIEIAIAGTPLPPMPQKARRGR